jgi:hypothetical protein
MTVNNDGVEVEPVPVEFDANIDQVIKLVDMVKKGVPEPVLSLKAQLAAEMRDINGREIIEKLEHVVGKENAEIMVSNYSKLVAYAEQQNYEAVRVVEEVVAYNRGVTDSIDAIDFYARN